MIIIFRMLLPPGEAETRRNDENNPNGIKNARRNYHRRSIFELGPKGNGFFRVWLIKGLHYRLWSCPFQSSRGQCSVNWFNDQQYFVETRSKERFEMLKEVNLHRKHYNRKRCSNNSAGRSNSFMGSGTIPATPKLGNKTNCAKLHFLIISRSRVKKFILKLHLSFS